MNLLVLIAATLSIICCLAIVSFAVYRQFIVFNQTRQFYDEQKHILSLRIAQIGNPVNAIKNNLDNLAWNGSRKFVLKGKVLEAEGICSFYFSPLDKRPLPPFIPGQYLTFQIQLSGQKKETVRCYSLSDSPNHPDYYRVTIKKISYKTVNSEIKEGLVSSYFHNKLQADDIIDIKAPSGHFYLDTESESPVVLIGGGIGITPVLSMINYIVNSGSKREVWLFYGVRNSDEHIMIDHLNELDRENSNVNIKICYSNPLESDELNVNHHYAERISLDLLKRVLPSSNYEYYICGPAPMMESLTTGLSAWGVPDSDINYEAFGPSTVKSVVSEEVTRIAQMKDITIKFAKSGIELEWDGISSSILEFAEKSDIQIESGCRSGNCGSCEVAIRNGDVEYLSQPGANIESGTCLACVSIPKNNLTLDA